jgi:TPR repeat protein
VDKPAALLAFGDVYNELNRCRAGLKLLLVDACRNDPLTAGARSRQTVDLRPLTRMQTPTGGVAALFSCSPGEKAFENERLQHGVFFHFVIEGLKGAADADHDRQVTLPELEMFVKKRVSDYVRAEHGASQMPELRGTTRGLASVINLDGGKRGFVGTYTQTVTPEMARCRGLARTSGAVVEAVLPEGPAARHGLRIGDQIVKVDGQMVLNTKQFFQLIQQHEPGTRARLEVVRNNRAQQMEILLGENLPVTDRIRRVLPAAQRGEAWAQLYLGNLYALSGAQNNPAEAARWTRQAADQGSASAQSSLAWMYATGRGIPRNDQEAFRWYRKAAEQGLPTAQNMAGVAYATGKGVAKDEQEAARWYRRAAEQGEMFAQSNLGRYYANGKGGLAKDLAEGVRWYRKSAAQGHAKAQNYLGWCYQHGRGVSQNLTEAVHWYRLAAEQGYAAAQSNLAWMYLSGKGVAKDEREAFNWFQEAADQGYASAQNQLGRCYLNGWGTDKDLPQAYQWFVKAAENGDIHGQANVGMAYKNGWGVDRNAALAVSWLRKSAENGNAYAQYHLGLAFERGEGVTADQAEALKWYRKAAAQGDDNARKAIQRLEAPRRA